MTTRGAQGVGQRRGNSAVIIAEGTARAYELKLEARTDRDIADILTVELHRAVSKSTVTRWISAAIKDRVEPMAEEYRAIMVDRRERSLARLERIYERAVDSGNDELALKTHDRMLREDESIRRLKGLDSATQITGDVTVRYEVTGLDPNVLR